MNFISLPLCKISKHWRSAHEAAERPAPNRCSNDWNERSEEHTSELQSLRHLVDMHSFPTRRSSDLDERKRVEMRFAHLKIHHGFGRMRLRGLSGARDEFHLAAIVQNLKTLALRSRSG